MPVFRSTKPSFASGRISERLRGRVDLEQYLTGCKEIENFLVFPHGGATFRSGTYFVKEVKDSADYVRLIPFIFSKTQSYILEVGPLYARVYFDRAELLDGGGSHVEITTPWDTGELDEVYTAQSGDILYCAQADYSPREIQRQAAGTWAIAEYANEDGPYYDLNDTATTLTPSGTTGSVTVTASSTTGINEGDGFQTTDVGRHVRMEHGGTWGWGKITARASTTQVTVSVQSDFGGTGAVTTWRLGAWADSQGWPEVVVFHQQRLWFARGEYLWGSGAADFVDFSPSDTDGTVTASHAITYRLTEGNFARWMQSARTLEVGLEGVEYVISGSGNYRSPLLPTEPPLASKEATEGSTAFARPVLTNRGTVFVNRTGRKLINFYYSFQKDGYEATDVTLLAEDITYPGILEVAYQAEPDKIIWAITESGQLLALTFDPTNDVNAWQTHVLGGNYGGGSSQVESIAVIPTPDGKSDELWLSVLRTVDGNSVRYIEYLTPLFQPTDAVEDAFFVDCGLSYSGSAVSSVSGLSHLEGETVAILADGTVRPPQTVNSGQVSVGAAATDIHIGLPYTGTITALPQEPNGIQEPLTGRRSKINHVGLLFYRTVLAKVGVEGKLLETVGGRDEDDLLGEAITPKTEFKKVAVGSTSQYRNAVQIQQTLPLPCTVLNFVAYIDYT